MKVLLIKDVYKLGRAGDIKRVADGYGRNYLLPQGLAVLATSGAMKQVENIRSQAAATRAALNQELGGVADVISKVSLSFAAKAGETGKLYGSITSQMIADAIQEKTGVEINRRQLDSEPIRNLGTYKVHVRLTVDLVPEVTVVVHREGEAPSLGEEAVEEEMVGAEAEVVEAAELAEDEAEVEVVEAAEPTEDESEVEVE